MRLKVSGWVRIGPTSFCELFFWWVAMIYILKLLASLFLQAYFRKLQIVHRPNLVGGWGSVQFHFMSYILVRCHDIGVPCEFVGLALFSKVAGFYTQPQLKTFIPPDVAPRVEKSSTLRAFHAHATGFYCWLQILYLSGFSWAVAVSVNQVHCVAAQSSAQHCEQLASLGWIQLKNSM